jgi:hypothetical protein
MRSIRTDNQVPLLSSQGFPPFLRNPNVRISVHIVHGECRQSCQVLETVSYKLSIALLKRPPEEGLSVEGTLPGRRRCQDFTAGMSQLLDTIAGKVGGQQWETLSWTSRSDSSIKLEASRIPLPFPLDGEVIETRTASVVWASEIEAIEVAVSQSTPRRLSLGDGSYIVDIDLQFGGANGAGDAA